MLSHMPVQTTTCKIDRDEKASVINALLASGVPMVQIERQMKAEGYVIKRETIKRHMERCVLGTPGAGAPKPALVRPAAPNGRPRATSQDIAILVQRRVAERLNDPDTLMRVDVKDGLAAQALLDKRAEKEKDRAFVLNLARLLSGAGQDTPLEIVDGEYVEVSDEEANDDEYVPRAPSLLAPPSLRDGS